MKRFLCLILALVSVFALSFTLTGCGEKETASLTYELQEDDTYMVTGVTTNETEIYIPSKKDGKTVTAIDSSAFRNNTTIKKVVLPDTLTFIDTSAFEGASALESINLDKVEILGKKVFKEAFGRVPKVEIKLSSLMSMGTGCFELAAGLKKVTISGPVVEIPTDAFSGCSGISSLVFGNYVKKIGDNAFKSCVSLETINFNKVEYVGFESFNGCVALSTINMPNMKRIMDRAFYGCVRLVTINIGNKLGQMYAQAFMDCKSMTYFAVGDYASEDYRNEWCYFMSLAGSGTTAVTGTISDSGYCQGSQPFRQYMADPSQFATFMTGKFNNNSCFVTKSWATSKGLSLGVSYPYTDLY